MKELAAQTPAEVDLLSVLQQTDCVWSGEGINHEKEPFTAIVTTRPMFQTTSLLMWFRATGTTGTIYHEEVALIGVQPDGTIGMASLSTSVPFIQYFTTLHKTSHLNAQSLSAIEFYHGDHSRRDGFREVISLSLNKNKELYFGFSWGMPGEDVESRSSVLLSQSSLGLPPDWPVR